GGFLGAYLGGLALTLNGDYQWMWYADIALSAMAGVINLPIKEAPIAKLQAA
ncbi:MAG: MFS transporter, partial [Betaproteobacteria bacterium]|nr:MFS transporter [Betaproteobacteria bacterium]